MIAEIIFGIAVVAFVAYKLFKSTHESLEKDMILSVREISRALKNKDSIETAILKAANTPTSAVKYYRRIIDKSREGLSFPAAIEFIGDKSYSKMFKLICNLLLVSIRSKKDVSKTLDDFAEKIDSLKQMQDELRARMAASLTMLKIVIIFVFPLVYIYATTIFGFPLDIYALLFLGFCSLMIGFMDLIMFNDIYESLFFFPFALSGFYVVYVKLAPLIVTFINSVMGTF